MLSKNFEYTGHLPYFFQMLLPTSVAPQSSTACASVKRSPPTTTVAQALVRHARPSLAAGVVEANQRSSMPPRFRP